MSFRYGYTGFIEGIKKELDYKSKGIFYEMILERNSEDKDSLKGRISFREGREINQEVQIERTRTKEADNLSFTQHPLEYQVFYAAFDGCNAIERNRLDQELLSHRLYAVIQCASKKSNKLKITLLKKSVLCSRKSKAKHLERIELLFYILQQSSGKNMYFIFSDFKSSEMIKMHMFLPEENDLQALAINGKNVNEWNVEGSDSIYILPTLEDYIRRILIDEDSVYSRNIKTNVLECVVAVGESKHFILKNENLTVSSFWGNQRFIDDYSEVSVSSEQLLKQGVSVEYLYNMLLFNQVGKIYSKVLLEVHENTSSENLHDVMIKYNNDYRDMLLSEANANLYIHYKILKQSHDYFWSYYHFERLFNVQKYVFSISKDLESKKHTKSNKIISMSSLALAIMSVVIAVINVFISPLEFQVKINVIIMIGIFIVALTIFTVYWTIKE